MYAFRCSPLALALPSSPLALPFAPPQLGTARNRNLLHPSLVSVQQKNDEETMARAIELIQSRPARTMHDNFQDLVDALTGIKDGKGEEQSPVELAHSLLDHFKKMLR